MNHSFDKECSCVVFKNKKLSLEMLCIHTILVQIESFFLDHGNFDIISDFYNITCLKQLIFHVRVFVVHMSQHKSSIFVMKCNLHTFFFVLKNYYNLNKVIFFSIEMLDVENYQLLEMQYKLDQNHINYEIFYE